MNLTERQKKKGQYNGICAIFHTVEKLLKHCMCVSTLPEMLMEN